MKIKINRIWIDSVTVSAITLFVAWLFYFVLDISIFKSIKKKDADDDILKYLYFIENKDAASDMDNNIVIFDIEGTKSRKAIANVIRKIETAHPKAIVLDFIFSANSETDTVSDNYLQKTVVSCNNIYTAIRLADNTLEHSYFSDKNIKEGLINHDSEFHPYEIYNGDTLFRMEYMIAGLNGTPNPNKRINYKNKYFDTWSIKDSIFDYTAITDKIVIIGDLQDLRDTYNWAFPIDGKRRIQGARLLAHKLSAVLNNTWIEFCQSISVIMAALLTFLFVVLSYKLKERLNNALCNVVIAVLKTLVFVLLLLVCYTGFSKYGKIINPVYTLIALPLISIGKDVFEIMQIAWNKISNKK